MEDLNSEKKRKIILKKTYHSPFSVPPKQLSKEQEEYENTLPLWVVHSLKRYFGYISLPPSE